MNVTRARSLYDTSIACKATNIRTSCERYESSPRTSSSTGNSTFRCRKVAPQRIGGLSNEHLAYSDAFFTRCHHVQKLRSIRIPLHAEDSRRARKYSTCPKSKVYFSERRVLTSLFSRPVADDNNGFLLTERITS